MMSDNSDSGLPGRDSRPSQEEFFSFSLPSGDASTYSYDDDTGISPGLGNAKGFIRLVFMVNAAAGVTVELQDSWANYAFYLDDSPVERLATSRHFQLVYDSASSGASFQTWASTAIQYLSGCFFAVSSPPFDAHDVAGVLLEVSRPRLCFKIIPWPLNGRFDLSLTLIPLCNNMLAVRFSPVDYFCPIEELGYLDSIEVSDSGMLTVGGAYNPYGESILMILGEPTIDT